MAIATLTRLYAISFGYFVVGSIPSLPGAALLLSRPKFREYVGFSFVFGLLMTLTSKASLPLNIITDTAAYIVIWPLIVSNITDKIRPWLSMAIFVLCSWGFFVVVATPILNIPWSFWIPSIPALGATLVYGTVIPVVLYGILKRYYRQ